MIGLPGPGAIGLPGMLGVPGPDATGLVGWLGRCMRSVGRVIRDELAAPACFDVALAAVYLEGARRDAVLAPGWRTPLRDTLEEPPRSAPARLMPRPPNPLRIPLAPSPPRMPPTPLRIPPRPPRIPPSPPRMPPSPPRPPPRKPPIPPKPPNRALVSLALASNRIPAHSAAPAAITSFDVVDLPAVPKGATIPAIHRISMKIPKALVTVESLCGMREIVSIYKAPMRC